VEPVVSGVTIHGQLYRGISAVYSFLPGFNFTFKVDPAGLTVALVTCFLWILSTIYAITYMTMEHARSRYDFMVLMSLAADLGVLLSGDFLTLFLFFEGMILFPYALVAHTEEKASVRGANFYLYLGLISSLCLLCGIVLLKHFTGTISIEPLGEKIIANMPGYLKYLVAALMIVGFGGKAGVFFEHLWLPEAHPVAPTPASCLLSGAMIKAGAYGIFRVANMILLPKDPSNLVNWIPMRYVGYAVIWLGVITMFFGVLNALVSANSKRMLAYHSVSQMGYIILGIGCAAYLGPDGAMGLAGAIYHIVNHALFKASLFLTVGAIYFRTHELDMYKLGGFWRKMPFTCVAMFIAVCGISGIPGFNGFASKTVLHHAIVEAYEHSSHYSPTGQPDFMLRIAEIIFMITAGGTFASNMKLWVLDFIKGDVPEKYKDVKPAPLPMKISFGLVSAAILFVGLNPNWMLEHLIGPALAYFNYNPSSHPYHVLFNTHTQEGLRSTIPLLYNPVNFNFFSDSEVVHNLLGGGDALILGGIIFILGFRFGWFHTEVPEWLTLGYYYKKVLGGIYGVCRLSQKISGWYNDQVEKFIFGKVALLTKSSELIHALEMFYDMSIEKFIFGKAALLTKSSELIHAVEMLYDRSIEKGIFGKSVSAMVSQHGKYESGIDVEAVVLGSAPEEKREVWDDISNLEMAYDHAIDRLIFGGGIKGLLAGGKARELHSDLDLLERKYGNLIDRLIQTRSIKSLISSEDGDKVDTEFKSELVKLEERYGEAVDKVILSRSIRDLIAKADSEEEMEEKLALLKEKYGDVYGEIISEEGLSALPRVVEKIRQEKSWWARFTEFDQLSYNAALDQMLFGSEAEEGSRQENAFDRFCRRISGIHTGDISSYISWIVIISAVIITMLVSGLYIESMGGFLVIATIFITLIIIGITLAS